MIITKIEKIKDLIGFSELWAKRGPRCDHSHDHACGGHALRGTVLDAPSSSSDDAQEPLAIISFRTTAETSFHIIMSQC